MAKTLIHGNPYREPLFRYLDLNGDGTGTKNLVGDYSTPDEAFIAPAAGEAFVIHRLLVLIEDGGTVGANTYGALAALTNGIEVKVKDGSSDIADLTDNVAIKDNASWGRVSYDVKVQEGFGSGNTFVLARWSFDKAGQPLVLRASLSEKLVVDLQDNLTGLVSHYFMVQGHKLNWL